MHRSTRITFIVSAIAAMVMALAAPSFACDGVCAQQVQAVYAQPLIQQQVLVPQYQQLQVRTYAQPLIQRQIIQQSYVQPLLTEQVLFNRVRFAPQRVRSIQIQRIRQPRVQRQVIRSRGVSVQAGAIVY